MKGDPLPAGDTFARYCKGSRVFEDGSGVIADAFVLRRDKTTGALAEDSLSGGWFERYEGADSDARLAALSKALDLTYRGRDRFALLNVGEAKEFVRANTADARVLRFLHEPEPGHDAHSAIFDTFKDEERISQLLAKAVSKLLKPVNA